jgi:hypothetical protein
MQLSTVPQLADRLLQLLAISTPAAVTGIASAAAGIATPASLQANDTYRVVGLPLWPSVGGNPNATVRSVPPL